MGKISDYIIELTETFGDLLDKHGNYEAAIDDMRDLLSKDEFEFFGAHLDVIEDNLGFTDGVEGVPMDEASGLKGDVLRPWGGRKARSKMGYGRGNRAGYDPEDEIQSEDELDAEDIIMQDIEDDDGMPMTSTIIDGEEIFDVGQSEDDWIYDTPETHTQRMKARKEMLAKPYPVGSGGEDNVFDDQGRRIEESYMMPPLNEDWTFIQEAGLILAAGAILIAWVKGQKGTEEGLSWRKWAEKFIPALKRKRVSGEIKQGVADYADQKIDIDALEKILVQDPGLLRTIQSLKTGNKYGYAQLYNKLKGHLGAYSIEGTPIKKIKGEFNKQGEQYKIDLENNKKAAKDALEAFGNGENDIQAVLDALSKSDEPGWGGLFRAFNKLVENPEGYYHNFYRAIKQFYYESYIKKTPGQKIVARLKREADNNPNDIQAGDPEAFNQKHMPESLEMPGINEWDDEDQWVTVNGKRMKKNSREYQKWYEEEGEFDDTEGREWRRSRYGR